METLKTMWYNFVPKLMQLLPLSPFKNWISYLQGVPYLSYINWFIPMKSLIEITAAWVSAIATYYLYSAILRWLNMVE